MRYISFCSGVEATSLAFEPIGLTPVAFCEIEPYPCAVLKARWPQIPNLGDLTKVRIQENGDIKYERNGAVRIIPNDGRDIDVCVGGIPCQSFSIAGKREGLCGKSGLVVDYIARVYELALPIVEELARTVAVGA